MNPLSLTDLFQIKSPEEILLEFPGKLYRYNLQWEKGKWIITNERLLFLADSEWKHELHAGEFFYMDSTTYYWITGDEHKALMVRFDQLAQVIQKKKKFIVKYLGPETSLSLKEYIDFYESIGWGLEPPWYLEAQIGFNKAEQKNPLKIKRIFEILSDKLGWVSNLFKEDVESELEKRRKATKLLKKRN